MPRYTSYPPANRFDETVKEADYRRWLAKAGPEETLSLYVHVPFCKVLCWYCGCHTMVANRAEQIERYLGALHCEIDRVAEALAAGVPAVHLHFGGGTPNLLSPDLFSRLVETLRDRFAFADEAEIAVEVDPRNFTDGHIAAFAACGVNRVSLGVQDISPDVQKLINRVQPFELVENAVNGLRAAGITRINADLMYGLPGQSVDHVRHSVQAVASLLPDRLAVFGYAHVPWFKKHQQAIDEDKLPGGSERLAQAEAMAEELERGGYIPIGLDHYARAGDALAVAQENGTLRRNFQGYTVDPATMLVGLGASSIGSLPQGFVQNEPHLGRYETAIAEGRLPIVRGLELTDDDRLRGAIIEKLMCQLEVDVTKVGQVPGDAAMEALDGAMPMLTAMRNDGLVELDGAVVRVTEAGRPYVRNVASCFDVENLSGAGRHSLAV